jgi:aspartyl aminopeptidase
LLDVELSFYDMQPGSIYGMHQEFIASARLDNLLSCFAGLQAVLSADGEQSCLFVATDHEEVGSASSAGADGNFLSSFLQRVLTTQEAFSRVMYRSMLISADNAHGVHPNYSEKHDANHGPLLNAGPVIKVNANQRYASNSETQSIFRLLCESNNIPVQNFVVRCDMACGSTIGPIAASNLGVRTIDVGVPTFAMHSIRETAGAKDAFYLYQAVKAFNALPKV